MVLSIKAETLQQFALVTHIISISFDKGEFLNILKFGIVKLIEKIIKTRHKHFKRKHNQFYMKSPRIFDNVTIFLK